MKVRTNSTLNDTSKDNSSTFKRKIPLFDDAESEWETDEEWGLRLASPSPSAGPSKKKIKTEKEDGPSVATAVLNPASTSPVIPSASVEVALSDEEDYSFMMTDPWIIDNLIPHVALLLSRIIFYTAKK